MIFPPGYIERNLKKCVSVCLAAFQLFSFMFLRPPPIPTQGVSFNHTLTAHSWSPTISNAPSAIFEVYSWSSWNVHFNLTVLGTTQCRPKLAGNFKPADRKTSWQDGERSEWKLWAAILTTADFLALSKIRESPRGCSPEHLGFMELGPRPSEGDFLLPLICIDLCIYLHKQTLESQQ